MKLSCCRGLWEDFEGFQTDIGFEVKSIYSVFRYKMCLLYLYLTLVILCMFVLFCIRLKYVLTSFSINVPIWRIVAGLRCWSHCFDQLSNYNHKAMPCTLLLLLQLFKSYQIILLVGLNHIQDLYGRTCISQVSMETEKTSLCVLNLDTSFLFYFSQSVSTYSICVQTFIFSSKGS